ncbi:hypothetical protein Tco_1071250, partial [Tanacetum coccineum]
MCKAYSGKPSLDVLQAFLNLGPASDWLTLYNRGGLKSFWEHSPKKPIIYHRGKEMDFRSFMVGGIDGEFHFEPGGGFADGEGNSLSNRSVNNEASVIDVAPLNFAPPSYVPENIRD